MPAPSPLAFVQNLLAYWPASGFTPGLLPDAGPNNLDLTCTGVSAGTTSTSDGWGLNGVPIVTTAGGGTAQSSAPPSTFKCLSDGSGMTFWCVMRAASSGTEYVFYDTGVSSTANVGGRLKFDIDVANIPSRGGSHGAINVEFTNGLGDGYVIDYVNGDWHSWNDTCTPDTPHAVVVTLNASTIPNIQIWVDGVLVAQLNTNDRVKEGAGRPLSTSDPSFAFRLFNSVPGLFPFVGQCAEAGIATSVWTEAERAAFGAWTAETYGVPPKHSSPGVLVLDGNSLVDNFWRGNQWPPPTTPSLRQRQFVNMRAIAGLTWEQMILRAPTEVIPNYNSNALYNVLFAWEFVNSLAEGDTPAEAFDACIAYCNLVRPVGFKVILSTLLPERFAVQSDGTYINGRLRAEWTGFADGLAEPDLDPVLGSWPLMIQDYGGGSGPKIIRTDGVHFTALGNQKLMRYFRKALNDLLPGETFMASPRP